MIANINMDILNNDTIILILSKLDYKSLMNIYTTNKRIKNIIDNNEYIKEKIGFVTKVDKYDIIRVLYNDKLQSYFDKPAVIYPNGNLVWCNRHKIIKISVDKEMEYIEDTESSLSSVCYRNKHVRHFSLTEGTITSRYDMSAINLVNGDITIDIWCNRNVICRDGDKPCVVIIDETMYDTYYKTEFFKDMCGYFVIDHIDDFENMCVYEGDLTIDRVLNTRMRKITESKYIKWIVDDTVMYKSL